MTKLGEATHKELQKRLWLLMSKMPAVTFHRRLRAAGLYAQRNRAIYLLSRREVEQWLAALMEMAG